MTEPCSAPAAGPDTGARHRDGLAQQILEVRSVLVSQLFRGGQPPMNHHWTPALERVWGRFLQSVQAGDPHAVADADWQLRAAIFQCVGHGLALSLLLQGEERLRQACGGDRAPAAHVDERLAAMQALVAAFKTGSMTDLKRIAITQVGLDQYDLESVKA